MNAVTLSVTAVLLYVLSAALLGKRLAGLASGHPLPRPLPLAAGLAAAAVHAVLLRQGLWLGDGVNLGFFSSLSLLAWLIVTGLLLASLVRPLESLALVFLPLAAVTVILSAAFPTQRILDTNLPWGLEAHILASLVAYSLLAIAAVHAVVLAIQDRHLHGRHPGGLIRALPPLTVMERLLFQIITLGFVLLSVALLTGLIFVQDVFAQHLAHKTVLSIVAWWVFAVLLWGRHRFGWRGRTAIRWTLGGFAVLMLAYLGSKFVLEFVLGR